MESCVRGVKEVSGELTLEVGTEVMISEKGGSKVKDVFIAEGGGDNFGAGESW